MIGERKGFLARRGSGEALGCVGALGIGADADFPDAHRASGARDGSRVVNVPQVAAPFAGQPRVESYWQQAGLSP